MTQGGKCIARTMLGVWAVAVTGSACVGINADYETGNADADAETDDGLDATSSPSSGGSGDGATHGTQGADTGSAEPPPPSDCPDRPGGLCLAPTVFPIAASEPSALAIADIDGDGHLDVAVADEKDDSVVVLTGDGQGLLEARPPVQTGGRPIALAVGDLDGDGRLDVATGDRDGKSVSVLLFDAEAMELMSSIETFVLDTRVSDVELLHGDDDDHLDAVVALRDEHALAFLSGRGDGTFVEPQIFMLPNRPEVLAAGNIDGDALVDLAVAFSEQDIATAYGPASAGLATTALVETERAQNALAIADADGDAAADLVSAQRDEAGIFIAWGDGAAVSAAPDIYPMSVSPHAVAVGDVSTDGDVDVVATVDQAASLLIMIGNSTHAFATVLIPLELPATALALGDLDEDGDLDIVLAGPNRITVLAAYEP